MDESAGLENRSTGNCTVGSNPTLSASYPLTVRRIRPEPATNKNIRSLPLFGKSCREWRDDSGKSTQVKDACLSGRIF